MTPGWVQLPASAITYCWTDDYVLHRGLSPYGARWNTSCDLVGLSLPDGVRSGSPALSRCRECFPAMPPELLARREASSG